MLERVPPVKRSECKIRYKDLRYHVYLYVDIQLSLRYSQSTHYSPGRTHVRHRVRTPFDSCIPLSTQAEAESMRAEAATAQSELRKAATYATSLVAARADADEKARKLREVADRLAPPK